jgi:hypothetical protein
MTKFTLSGPGGQETKVEAVDLDDACLIARRFGLRYGILGEVDVYEEKCVMPAETIQIKDDRPIYMFIYCASEQGSLSRRCDDDTAARKHAHILADAHGETCHIARYTSQKVGEGAKAYSIGAVEPRIPKN